MRQVRRVIFGAVSALLILHSVSLAGLVVEPGKQYQTCAQDNYEGWWVFFIDTWDTLTPTGTVPATLSGHRHDLDLGGHIIDDRCDGNWEFLGTGMYWPDGTATFSFQLIGAGPDCPNATVKIGADYNPPISLEGWARVEGGRDQAFGLEQVECAPHP